jgi:hypothetical protein
VSSREHAVTMSLRCAISYHLSVEFFYFYLIGVRGRIRAGPGLGIPRIGSGFREVIQDFKELVLKGSDRDYDDPISLWRFYKVLS